MKMTVFHVFFLVLVMWAVHSHGRAYETGGIIYNNTQQPSKENMNTELLQYDFFYLVMQWGNTYLINVRNRGRCHVGQIPNYFTVHGLWPQRNVGPHIDCTGASNATPFNLTQLYQNQTLWNELKNFWPNLREAGQNECFWKYEYDKHGSCFFQTLDYFQSTLGMMDDIPRKLELQGIKPRTRYWFSDLHQKIYTATGVVTRVECDPWNRLYQVYFCVGIDKKLIDCAYVSTNINCWTRQKIRIP